MIEKIKENIEKSSYYYINGELSIFVDNGKIYLVKYDGNKEKYFELPKTKKLLKLALLYNSVDFLI